MKFPLHWKQLLYTFSHFSSIPYLFQCQEKKRGRKKAYKELLKKKEKRKSLFRFSLHVKATPKTDWKHYKTSYLKCHTGRLFPTEQTEFEKDVLVFFYNCVYMYTYALPHLLQLLLLKRSFAKIHSIASLSALHFHLVTKMKATC